MAAGTGTRYRRRMQTPAFGPLLKSWRTTRRVSQLGLALDAGVSARHLSYVETGKARPSRDMVARLADTLELPLRERNSLLVAAGFAPRYSETALVMPALSSVNRAIDLMLRQQEPYPAFVLNRHWDILHANEAARRVTGVVMGGKGVKHRNMLRQIFDPDDLRPAVANWEEVAGDLIRHLHEAVAANPSDDTLAALLDEALAYPGVPARWRHRDLDDAPAPLLTTVLRRGPDEFRFFSTITSFATPRDVTLEEIRIECCFPDNDATIKACARLNTL
jgi:transcriptional regulator with XRE-family HTH domain